MSEDAELVISPIYISGPMRGIPNDNYDNFNHVAQVLQNRGFVVLNPAAQFNGDRSLPMTTYFRKDAKLLLGASSVALLPGWDMSEGAKWEVAVAQKLGLSLWEWNYETEMLTPLSPDTEVRLVVTDALCRPDPEEPKETILEEAQRLVYGDRGQTYGHPLEDFSRTARIWGAVLDLPYDLTAEQVALCLVGLKMARETYQPKRDNRTDMAGYALCLDRIVRRREELAASVEVSLAQAYAGLFDEVEKEAASA